MRRALRSGLRRRLVLSALLGALVLVAILVAGFNVLLQRRLARDADSLLVARAGAQLPTLSTVDGRLQVPEAPDQAAPDTQTWIFSAHGILERPVVGIQVQHAAEALVGRSRAFATVQPTNTRLYAVGIAQGRRKLGTVVVAVSLGPYQRSAQAALVASLILGALTVLGVGAGSWWLIGRALEPVASMTAAAAEWGDHDGSRRFLAGAPHDELTALAATFDRLLDRVSQSLVREQRITAEISHELRTPLAGIVAEAELAMARTRTPESYRQALAAIHASASDLGRSLEVLLTSGRAQGGGPGRISDAREVADRAATAARAAARPRGVSVEITAPAAALAVAAEPDLAERALAPIIDNAARHAEHRVAVTLRRRDGEVLFKVSDDGPGVDPAVRERLFEPGVSGRAAGGGAGSGAGLGFALSRRLARAAGGEVEHVSDDGGTAFVLRLPAA